MPEFTPRVHLDCDTGIDDALALIYLAGLHSAGEIELVAVTTTAGNTTAYQAALNSAYVLERCGLSVPIAAGEPRPIVLDLVTTPETHGEHGFGYLNPPSREVNADWQALWELPTAHRIITGPATNIAQLGKCNQQVTLMGGTYNYPGNTTPSAEWNSWVDPHAAKYFFRENHATVCSLEVTEQFTVDPHSLNTLIDALGDTPIAEDLPELLRFYFEFHEAQGEGYLAQIHDALTCMIALGKIPFEGKEVTVDVEASDSWLRGTTVADLRGHWNRQPNAYLVTSADTQAAHRELQRSYELLAHQF